MGRNGGQDGFRWRKAPQMAAEGCGLSRVAASRCAARLRSRRRHPNPSRRRGRRLARCSCRGQMTCAKATSHKDPGRQRAASAPAPISNLRGPAHGTQRCACGAVSPEAGRLMAAGRTSMWSRRSCHAACMHTRWRRQRRSRLGPSPPA
eukprot:6197478-Pleurochrysis_carterae.AAC.3